MIKYIWRKVFGSCRVSCNESNAEELLRILRDGGFTTDPVRLEGGKCTVTVPESVTSGIKKAAACAEVELTVERLPGIPLLIHKYRHRPGILIGAVLFFVIITLSGRIIWDYDITGNMNVSDTEIIEALEKLGCGAGTFISDVDFDLVQNDLLIDADRLAWVSVNMDGNLARVEVMEKRVLPMNDPPKDGRLANIVAAEDGIVELCRVRGGKAVVEQGTVVKKGELLITGVIDVGETDVRYEYAAGEVMAKVYREVVSYVPFSGTVQAETGAKKTEIQLKVFGNQINLSRRGSIDWALYGKIIDERKLSLPFGIALPVWVRSTVWSELQEETVLLTKDEALAKARSDAESQLRVMAEELQVLSVSESVTADETGVTVTLGVYGVTDISANLGFNVSEGDTEKEEEKPQNEENRNS